MDIKNQDLDPEVLEYIKSLEKEKKSLENKVDDLENKLSIALNSLFGKSSEKVSPLQAELFEEFTIEAFEDVLEELLIPEHKRAKKGRKAIDPSLPREIIEHDIPEEDKKCACGCDMFKIDEVATEKLQIIPEKVHVERHIRPKYACRNCEGSGDEDKPVFRIAPAPPSLIPGSIMTGGLLSYILINKFCDYLPFYRQEKRFERFGAPISRQNMSNWTIKFYRILKELSVLMKDKIRSVPFLQMDETTVQIHGEEEKPDSLCIDRGEIVNTESDINEDSLKFEKSICCKCGKEMSLWGLYERSSFPDSKPGWLSRRLESRRSIHGPEPNSKRAS